MRVCATVLAGRPLAVRSSPIEPASKNTKGKPRMEAELLMGRCHGVASRSQLLEAGATRHQIDHRVATGRWQRVHLQVYRLTAMPESWLGRVLAACLATGGLASHRAGAVLWDLGIYREPTPEITVDRSVRSTPAGVLVHQTTQWDRRDAIELCGIPTTGIERTLLDCAAVVTLRRLERLCEAAIRQRKTTWSGLAETLSLHSRRGRNGCGPMRTLLEGRLGTEVPLSDFSRLVANLLEDHDIERPAIEYRVESASGEFIMQADLAWPRRRKILELDGLAYHFGRVERERDNRKRNRAKAEGWNVFEVLWSMYVDNPTALVAQVRQFLTA